MVKTRDLAHYFQCFMTNASSPEPIFQDPLNLYTCLYHVTFSIILGNIMWYSFYTMYVTHLVSLMFSELRWLALIFFKFLLFLHERNLSTINAISILMEKILYHLINICYSLVIILKHEKSICWYQQILLRKSYLLEVLHKWLLFC